MFENASFSEKPKFYKSNTKKIMGLMGAIMIRQRTHNPEAYNQNINKNNNNFRNYQHS